MAPLSTFLFRWHHSALAYRALHQVASLTGSAIKLPLLQHKKSSLMLDAINIPRGDDHLPFTSFPGTQPIGPPMHVRDDMSEIPAPPKINKGSLQELMGA